MRDHKSWCAEYGNCTPENSIGYSKKTIENKRNFSLHTGDLVKKCHTLQTGTNPVEEVL